MHRIVKVTLPSPCYCQTNALSRHQVCLDRLLVDSKLFKRWHLHSHSCIKYVSGLSLKGFFFWQTKSKSSSLWRICMIEWFYHSKNGLSLPGPSRNLRAGGGCGQRHLWTSVQGETEMQGKRKSDSSVLLGVNAILLLLSNNRWLLKL